ncbi:MAG TPA: glycyl-radical enzyme activating protein [Deltaproteobacteria bacterium]|nr:glycyl-radical enzyme activating protein [Deltaproteobacteria bacterium]
MDSSLLRSPEKGVVFNIQRFSVHDGPGIRTTVFLKGCPLGCLWCSNPESQDFAAELMTRDILCTGCGACVKICPEDAITITRKTGRIIDRKKCNNCMLCVDVCAYQSLTACGKEMSAEEIVTEVLKDKLFYKNSGGGVTLSGGEPLSQSGFALQILRLCKSKGLHSALDTSGYGRWEDLEKLLEFTDLLLFDIKHLDEKTHKKTTGVDNKIILDNLRKAAGKARLWLRMPLIAGYNDGEEHIRKAALLAKETGAQKISLLAYHEGGKNKSTQMGKAYPMPDTKAPADSHIQSLKVLIEEMGLAATIDN